MQTISDLTHYLQQAELYGVIKAFILLIAGFFAARFSGQASQRLVSRYASAQQTIILQKTIYFFVLILFIVAALQQLGFKLSVLLGSAGIITGALAIAAQTSISNVVSGFFLMLEKSFKIGDQIKVGTTVGTVSAIDLLSIKLLNANNTLIRLPNESLIKTEITNITRFESRRLDVPLKVSVEEDIEKIKLLLLEIAKNDPFILKTPLPSVSIQKIESSKVHLQLSVWVEQDKYADANDSCYINIIKHIQQHSIQT